MENHYDWAMAHGKGRGRGGRRMNGPGGWGGPGPGWGGGGGGRRRMRRGDIRKAVLSALQDGPAHGYEVMRRLEERSGGIWRPSPGSVYPTLQMLEDEALVRSSTENGTRTYELTDTGREEAEARTEERGGRGVPWEFDGEGADQARTLKASMGQTFLAFRQLATAGSPEQVERGLEILQRARRELYQILAED
ncbi:MAG TPA: PadR family transcriptional regulator [Acidimicrobiales bacterium]|jgi:DNA-binding PadR family transcriptional regulator|nr:PadR family transcriptional regulator [Acidimicrobiales bacterium]